MTEFLALLEQTVLLTFNGLMSLLLLMLLLLSLLLLSLLLLLLN